MADIAASILGPFVTEELRKASAAIKRQFYYLCCFATIINNLKEEAENLQATTQDLQGIVDSARNDLRVITSTAETWSKRSKDMKDETNGILNEVQNVKSGCLKFGARFCLSRRAKKTTDLVKLLRDQCPVDDNVIFQPRPPAATVPVPTGTTYGFESRKQIEDDIMAALVGGDVSIMGICGMGGLGKTTIAKKIMNNALKNKVFDEVVITTVSQLQPPVNKLKIQVDIGVSLGLSCIKDETNENRAAQVLNARLSDSKRTLLVLDDVWQKLVLEDLGIPCNHKGCTILLTSRNGDILRSMKVMEDAVFGMKVLSEEEAWFLFKETTGPCVDNAELNSIAKDVVNKCKGLPIALKTVGAALSEEKDVRVWRDSLQQLTQEQRDIPDWIPDVYDPLKLSYDFLNSDQKRIVLLCCLYPEDYDIPIDELTYFSMGLGIYEGNLKGARDRMFTLIQKLKNRSMLLDSDREEGRDNYVRMHDVVRDVCIFIAKEEKFIGGNDCKWISSSHSSELPTTSATLPNLRLLFWNRGWADEESFLERVKDLSVLFMKWFSLTSLPHTTKSLKNLKTLVLLSCDELQTLSVLGELANLEILICCYCISIEELAPEMKELTRLKLLDLTECRSLKRIGRGIISSLVGLEELKMRRSFNKWEAEDREERENAGLRELEALTNLRCLEIEIEDPALSGENFHLRNKLDRFQISFLDRNTGYSEFTEFQSNKLGLKMEEDIKLGPWMMELLPVTECLYLRGEGANNVDLEKIQKIRWLKLSECETTTKIVRTSMDWFSSIEHLDLDELPNLEQIWDGDLVSPNSFQNLNKLQLDRLPALKHIVMNCLPQLKDLEIVDCSMMEQVFLWKGESCDSQSITQMFPKLNSVELRELPNLNTFCQGIEGVEFPQLSILDIRDCKKLTSMVSKGIDCNENNTHIQDLSCQPLEVSFGCLTNLTTDWNPFRNRKIDISFFNGLKEFEINGYEGSTSFIKFSIAENLVNLTKLIIEGCDEMAQVITNDENKGMSGGQSTLLRFPKLQELILRSLPKLVSFCEWKCDVELPLLREVEIVCCPNMKNVTMGSLNAPNLESLVIELDNYHDLQVLINASKKLTISLNETPLTCDKIDISHFSGLRELKIRWYKGRRSLFQSSVAGSLVNLASLTIDYCDRMVKVIEDDEEKDNVGNGYEGTSLFPKLQKLKLECLSKLVSFCDWKCDVELPSLREVEIIYCRKMKRCTLGRLTTPNLEHLSINWKNFGAVQDLNGLIQQVYERNPNSEVEMEDSEEEEGEIVEEQK